MTIQHNNSTEEYNETVDQAISISENGESIQNHINQDVDMSKVDAANHSIQNHINQDVDMSKVDATNHSIQNNGNINVEPVINSNETSFNNNQPNDDESRTIFNNKLKKLPLIGALLSYLIGYSFTFSHSYISTQLSFAKHGITKVLSPFMNVLLFIFILLFFGWGEYLMKDIKRKGYESFLWMGCSIVIWLSFCLSSYHNMTMVHVYASYIFPFMLSYWVLVRAGKLTEGRTGICLPLDLLSGITSSFQGIFHRIKRIKLGLTEGINKINNWRSVLISIVVILLAIPLFMTAASLLTSADSAFSYVWENITNIFSAEMPSWLPTHILYFITGIPCSALMYGCISHQVARETPKYSIETLRERGKRLRLVPALASHVILGGFIALYGLFFTVHAANLLGAFQGVIPGDLTASAYARAGFFQLCKVMIINFGLFGFIYRCNRDNIFTQKALKIMSIILHVESAFLAITAVSKVYLYINRFGLTPLRLLTVWGTAILFIACILSIVHLIRRCRVSHLLIWIAAITFSLMCLI